MHCHIAAHVSEGLAVQFLEQPQAIVYPDPVAYQETCQNWDKYYPTAAYPKIDSGL